MSTRLLKRAAALLLVLSLTIPLTGCWGKHELTELYFVTAIALDKSDESGKIDFAFQVAKMQSSSSGSTSGGAKSSGKAALVLKATASSMSEAVNTVNRNSSRVLFIHHNQVILFSEELARDGLSDHIDVFMRNLQSRMEVPIVVVEGKAVAVLEEEMALDEVTGTYLSRTLDSRASISPNYRVSILGFVSRLHDSSVAPVVPLLNLVKEEDQTHIEIDGMAVFQGTRMIGKLDNNEVFGYIWAMGDVTSGRLDVESEEGHAIFQIESLKSTWTVTREDGKPVGAALHIEANLLLEEMTGYAQIGGEELVDSLRARAAAEIRNKITQTFEKAVALDADIFGIGMNLHRHHKAQWHAVMDNWDAEFQQVALDIEITAFLPSMGKVIQSVEMEGKNEPD